VPLQQAVITAVPDGNLRHPTEFDTAMYSRAYREGKFTLMSDWLYTPYLLMSAAAALLSFGVAAYVYQRRAAPGGMLFTLLMCATGFWALANTFEFLSQSFALKILSSKISYFGILSIAPLWLMFALAYARPESRWLGRRSILLWILPALLTLLVWTNELHGLIWPDIQPMQTEPNLLVRYDHGVAFWVTICYIYVLLLLGTLELVKAVLRSTQLFKIQVALLLVALSLPWIGNLLYITRLVSWADQDLTPIAFALSGILVALGMFRYQMLDIVPIARGQLIEHMSDGVLVLDDRNRILDVNPAAAVLLGGNAESYIGLVADSVAAIPNVLRTRYREAVNIREEIQVGARHWFDVRISSLHGRGKARRGRLVVFRNITARKLAEIELRRYAAELEAGNAELDAFAHTVAHDLRNPLSIIVGFSEALDKHSDILGEQEIKEHLGFIADSGRKMQSIIDALLLLANVRRSGEVPVVTLDMTAITTEVLRSLSPQIAERGASVDLPESWPAVMGHPVWVENIWVNYLGNALKYGTRSDGTPMSVRMGWDREHTASSSAPMIRFWVKDNGTGLTPEQCARLFTPFTRLHLDEAEGHGLGLSIVERIVTRLGGNVGVSSIPGEGSMFWFTLQETADSISSAE